MIRAVVCVMCYCCGRAQWDCFSSTDCVAVVGMLTVCGVHIYNQGSQLNPEIKQWDVKVLMVGCRSGFCPVLFDCGLLVWRVVGVLWCGVWQIHPDKRHLDKVAAKEFWRFLFAFIKVKLQ